MDPFEYGATYRVRKDFEAPRDRFRTGEILVYWRFARSVYDGMQGWFFRVAGSSAVRSWDVPLGDDPRDASDLFERVAGPAPIVSAVTSDDPDAVGRALTQGDGPAFELDCALALERAIERGRNDAVRELLQAGLLSGRLLKDMLRHAAGLGRTDAVGLLLHAGCPVDACDPLGQTALVHAAFAGHLATVALLLERGADPSVTTSSGATPRSLAVARRAEGVVALIDAAPGRRPGPR